MKTKKKSAQALTPKCQQGRQENLYQPGIYWVEITDHGIEKDPAGARMLWIEILPIRRFMGFKPLEGDCVAQQLPDPLAPYHDKRRVYLRAESCEYAGAETDPIRIRADVVLHSGLDPISTDPHGLIGATLKFELAHLKMKGVMHERWMLQGPTRKFGIEDCYN